MYIHINSYIVGERFVVKMSLTLIHQSAAAKRNKLRVPLTSQSLSQNHQLSPKPQRANRVKSHLIEVQSIENCQPIGGFLNCASSNRCCFAWSQ